MSTKRKIKEQQERDLAAQKAGERMAGVRVVYLVVCLIVFAGLIIASAKGMFLMKNSRASKNVLTNIQSYTPWPQEVREAFQKILVQNGGRVKPLNTYGRFSLMQMNNLKNVKFETKDGQKHKIKSDEWLLDVLFRGDIAKELPIFNVDDTDVIAQLGIGPKQGDSALRKRDRFSYNHLATQRAAMAKKSGEISDKREKYNKSDKDPNYKPQRDELILLRLSQNISLFEFLVGQFAAVRMGDYHVNEGMLTEDMIEISKKMDVAEFLEITPELSPQQMFYIISGSDQLSEIERSLQPLLRLQYFYANSARHFNLFPPADKLQDEWFSLGELMMIAMADKKERPKTQQELGAIRGLYDTQKTMFAGLENLGTDKVDESAYEAIISPMVSKMNEFAEGQKKEVEARYQARLDDLNAKITAASAEPLEQQRLKDKLSLTRKEASRSGLEIHLHNTGYFHSSLSWFIFGLLVTCIGFAMSGTKAAKYVFITGAALIVLALVYNILGITIRSIVRNRPPITNLYDTVIFITGTVVLLALLIERFLRNGIGLLLAGIAGTAGTFLSMKYEIKEAVDTMDPLQAVLDTNFWLATHVVTINLGYAAGLLAMLLGLYYLVHRFVRPLPRVVMSMFGKGQPWSGGNDFFQEDKQTRDHFKLISAITYGVICFCLLLSIVGTVLGGVWANYSWGRFWGWDPKENGALMICLWSLVIMHARMGGYIRGIGMAVNSIILGMIVSFSWWGVNNLGIGLHSYGFTDGVWSALGTSWLFGLIVMLCGIPLWLNDLNKKKAKKEKSRAKQDFDLSEGATA